MFRFADFRVDPAALRVFQGDEPLDAPPQAVEVLVYLIEHGERTVGRQELLDRFWPRAGTGGDAALNTCIRRIRTLLADNADRPRFIQTRPRSGYRFIGALLLVETAPARPAHKNRRFAIMGGLLAPLAIGGMVWAKGTLFPAQHRILIEPVRGLCEYVLFPRFNAGLRESFVAELSQRLPANYAVAVQGEKVDHRARISVRQTPARTTVVVTLAEIGSDRVLWSGQFAAPTDMQDYVPLQERLAKSMATDLARALS